MNCRQKGHPYQRRWASSKPLRARIEQKGRRRANLPCLLEWGHPSSPALEQGCYWILALWTWTRTYSLLLGLQVRIGTTPPALLMAGLSFHNHVSQSLIIDLFLYISTYIYVYIYIYISPLLLWRTLTNACLFQGKDDQSLDQGRGRGGHEKLQFSLTGRNFPFSR